MSDVTEILSTIEQGDPSASAELFSLVYGELRKLATQKMSQENPGQTLQATALVHEAYLRLVDVDKVTRWESRGHFFAAAAEAMRRIIVERARKRSRREQIQGARIPLEELSWASSFPQLQMLTLDDALRKLEAHAASAAQVVKLRFFAGLTLVETASAMGIPLRTAERSWTYARTWLHRELEGSAT